MIIYTVKQGDTLFSIAANYNQTPESLAEVNGISETVNLAVGQNIIIPSDENDILGEIAVNGYSYPYIDRNLLYKALPYLTYLSVFSYGFTESGELVVPDDFEIVQIANEYGVAPVMVITTLTENGNFSNELASALLNNISLQDTLIDNIVNMLIQKNYYALDVDFEFIFPEEENQFINFLSKLKTILEENGFKLFVSLAPKTSADQQGLLYEAHNYKRVGEIADLALLMTYEWGYTYGPPMAVSPLNKVDEVVQYAKTEIPPEKMTMGVPNYGYNWTLPYVRGDSKATSISNPDAVSLAAEYNAEILFDEQAQTPYFYYTDNENKQHVVWFEDARSIYAKLLLAFGNSLHGVGIWNIMRDFPQMWVIIAENFNIKKVL